MGPVVGVAIAAAHPAETERQDVNRSSGTETTRSIAESAAQKGLDPAERPDGAARNGLRALGVYGLRLFGAALAFGSQIALARWLSAAEYGIYASIFVGLMLLGGWLSLGLGAAMIRFVPEYKALGRLDLLRGLRRTSFGVALGVSGLIACLALVLVSADVSPVSAGYRGVLFYAALMLPFLALTEINDGYCRGQGLPIRAMAPSMLLRPLLLLTGIGIGIALFSAQPMAENAMVAMLVAVAITAVVQMAIAMRSQVVPDTAQVAATGTTPAPPRYDFRLWFDVSLPLVLVEGLLQLMNNVDVLLVGALLTPADVGHYYAATRILTLVGFVPVAVIAVTAPSFAHFSAKDDTANLSRSVNQAMALSFWPALAIALAMILVGPLLLAAFGATFTDAYGALLILMIAAVARAALAPAQTMLVMTGHHRAGMAILGGAVVVNAGLNLLMIPAFGITGAAIATALAVLMEIAVSAHVIRRRFGFNPMPSIHLGDLRRLLRSRLGGERWASTLEEV